MCSSHFQPDTQKGDFFFLLIEKKKEQTQFPQDLTSDFIYLLILHNMQFYHFVECIRTVSYIQIRIAFCC